VTDSISEFVANRLRHGTLQLPYVYSRWQPLDRDFDEVDAARTTHRFAEHALAAQRRQKEPTT
jgi:hypothetical protein